MRSPMPNEHSLHQRPHATFEYVACHMWPLAHCHLSLEWPDRYRRERHSPPRSRANLCACLRLSRCMPAHAAHQWFFLTEEGSAHHVCPFLHRQCSFVSVFVYFVDRHVPPWDAAICLISSRERGLRPLRLCPQIGHQLPRFTL